MVSLPFFLFLLLGSYQLVFGFVPLSRQSMSYRLSVALDLTPQQYQQQRVVTTEVKDGKRRFDVHFTAAAVENPPLEMSILSKCSNGWFFKHIFRVLLPVIAIKMKRFLQPLVESSPSKLSLSALNDNYVKTYVRFLGRVKCSVNNVLSDYIQLHARSALSRRSPTTVRVNKRMTFSNSINDKTMSATITTPPIETETGLIGLALRSYMLRTGKHPPTSIYIHMIYVSIPIYFDDGRAYCE